MISFSPPKSKLIIEKSSFKHEKSRHQAFIDGHHLNHAVEILIPGCEDLPIVLKESSPDDDEFLIFQNVPLAEFVQEKFISSIMKTGKFSALSVCKNVDSNTVAAILSTGHLMLSVDKDIFQTLGLPGKPSKFSGRKPTRYFIEVDLFSEHHKSGKKQYDRVVWALTDRLDLTFNFLVLWQGIDENEVNLSKLSSLLGKYNMTALSNNVTVHQKHTVIPKITNHRALKVHMASSGESSPSTEEVFEWIGAASCNINQNGYPGNYASSYFCPGPSPLKKQVICQKWMGFISCDRIKEMLESLRCAVRFSDSIPWASLTVHGFDDSPVSWWRREHGYHKNGDNLYTFLIFPDDTYWLYLAIGTNDEFI